MNKKCRMNRGLIFGFILLLNYCDGLIVPKEVSELFTLLLPAVKKGTDSRFGIGFRFGEHADFQTIIELGPQKFTQTSGKIDNDEAEEFDTSKRMVYQWDQNKVEKPTHRWIQNWTNGMENETTKKKSQKTQNNSVKSLFSSKDQYPIPTASIINSFALGQLHSKQNESADQTNEILPSYSMETHVLVATMSKKYQQTKSDLMDVSLDD